MAHSVESGGRGRGAEWVGGGGVTISQDAFLDNINSVPDYLCVHTLVYLYSPCLNSFCFNKPIWWNLPLWDE